MKHIKHAEQGVHIPEEFGEHFYAYVSRTYYSATERDSSITLVELEKLASIADEAIGFALKIDCAWYQNECKKMDQTSPDYDLYHACSTERGLLLQEGHGRTLISWLESDPCDSGSATTWASIEKIMPTRHIPCVLYAYALSMLDAAMQAKFAKQFNESLHWMAIAGDLIRSAEQHEAWDDATKHAKWLAAEPRRRGAATLHIDTYALRAEVIEHWRNNIDRNLSADKAAKVLSKFFPLSLRKMSSYISQEKNNTSC